MKKSDVIRHLGLALQGDPDSFREKVEKLYHHLTRPQPVIQQVTRRPKEFFAPDNHTWIVTLDRTDAKRVEEIFYNWLAEKKIEGEWKPLMRNGKIAVYKKTNMRYQVTFKRVPEKLHLPRVTAQKKDEPLNVISKAAAKLTDAEKAELLKQLEGI